MSDSDVAARVRSGTPQRRIMDDERQARFSREPSASGSVSTLDNDDADDGNRDRSATTDEQRRDGRQRRDDDDNEEREAGLPLRREADEVRTGRRTITRPPDPATTRDYNMDVERGDRVHDMTGYNAGAGDRRAQRESPGRNQSCSTPGQRGRQSTTSAAATHIRSVISRPALMSTVTGGIGRGMRSVVDVQGSSPAAPPDKSTTILNQAGDWF